jgi:glutathione transport system ATP-binding protein
MIFQEPMTCLNPVLSIRTQLTEPLLQHQGMDANQAEEVALSLLKRVRIPDPEKKLDQYPHHLSGGMRQRAMIAMALCCKPSLLIADEPTTALDVTIQAQILDLIKDLQAEFGMSVMFITHDMAVIAEMADRVVVMFNGEVVEQGPVDQIFHSPKHDYTKKLINAVPRIGSMTGKSSPEKFPLAVS